MLAAELRGAAIQSDLIQLGRALKQHVLGHVGEPGQRAVEAGAGADRQRNRRQRAGVRLGDDARARGVGR